jgi:hypothetical protein
MTFSDKITLYDNEDNVTFSCINPLGIIALGENVPTHYSTTKMSIMYLYSHKHNKTKNAVMLTQLLLT